MAHPPAVCATYAECARSQRRRHAPGRKFCKDSGTNSTRTPESSVRYPLCGWSASCATASRILARTLRAPLGERSRRYSKILSRSAKASEVYRTLIDRGAYPLPQPLHRTRTRRDQLEPTLWPQPLVHCPTSRRRRCAAPQFRARNRQALPDPLGPGRSMLHNVFQGLRRHRKIIPHCLFQAPVFARMRGAR